MHLRTLHLITFGLAIFLGGALLTVGATAEESPTTTEEASTDPNREPLTHHGTVTILAPEAAPEDGTAAAQSIFGTDDRIRSKNTRDWPDRLISKVVLFDEYDRVVGTCSGIMISANTLLTAAHCLYDYDRGRWYTTNMVIPGEDGSYRPYGSAFDIDASIYRGYALTGDPMYDVGILKVSGWGFGPVGPYPTIASVTDTYFANPNVLLYTAGYPGDKPLATQWWSIAPVQYVDAYFIYTTMDAYAGQSGSPIFTVNLSNYESYVVGVYSYENGYFNAAVRFTATDITFLRNFCVSAGCSFNSTILTNPTPVPTATATQTATPTRTPTPIVGASMPYRNRLPAVSRD